MAYIHYICCLLLTNMVLRMLNIKLRYIPILFCIFISSGVRAFYKEGNINFYGAAVDQACTQEVKLEKNEKVKWGLYLQECKWRDMNLYIATLLSSNLQSEKSLSYISNICEECKYIVFKIENIDKEQTVIIGYP